MNIKKAIKKLNRNDIIKVGYKTKKNSKKEILRYRYYDKVKNQIIVQKNYSFLIFEFGKTLNIKLINIRKI